jgi:hypothetical protein
MSYVGIFKRISSVESHEKSEPIVNLRNENYFQADRSPEKKRKYKVEKNVNKRKFY